MNVWFHAVSNIYCDHHMLFVNQSLKNSFVYKTHHSKVVENRCQFWRVFSLNDPFQRRWVSWCFVRLWQLTLTMRRNYYRALVDSTAMLHSAPNVVPLVFSQQLTSRFDSPSDFFFARGNVVELRTVNIW